MMRATKRHDSAACCEVLLLLLFWLVDLPWSLLERAFRRMEDTFRADPTDHSVGVVM